MTDTTALIEEARDYVENWGSDYVQRGVNLIERLSAELERANNLAENWRNDSREETERAERLQNELDWLRLGNTEKRGVTE